MLKDYIQYRYMGSNGTTKQIGWDADYFYRLQVQILVEVIAILTDISFLGKW
jgi:hypothetical protein